MKKPGWNPKKGLVQPTTALSTANPEVGPDEQGENRPEAGSVNQSDSADTSLSESRAQISGGQDSSGTSASYVDTDEVIDLSTPITHKRAAWKSAIHWLAAIFCLFFLVTALGFEIQGFLTKPVTLNYLSRFFFREGLVLFVVLLVMPSIVFEAHTVTLQEDCIILSNLIKKSVVPWKDIQWIYCPLYLKFAILKTPRFFQLINKRDIAPKQFYEVLHIIKVKTGQAKR